MPDQPRPRSICQWEDCHEFAIQQEDGLLHCAPHMKQWRHEVAAGLRVGGIRLAYVSEHSA